MWLWEWVAIIGVGFTVPPVRDRQEALIGVGWIIHRNTEIPTCKRPQVHQLPALLLFYFFFSQHLALGAVLSHLLASHLNFSASLTV